MSLKKILHLSYIKVINLTRKGKVLSQRLLEFTGQWRPYQASVLEKFKDYLDDSKLHLIAAPGSGKTVLGLELVNRLAQPALILVPRLSIQRQWAAAIDKLFQARGEGAVTVSQSVETEATITIITYQALETLMARWKGRSAADLGAPEGFVLVLDECHHMVGAWADTAAKLIAAGYISKVVSLTATPPYDAEAPAWAKYQQVCGDADFEISTAELVSHNSLCPHQDFVYVSQPLNAEYSIIQDVCDRRDQLEQQILGAEETRRLIADSIALFDRQGAAFQIDHINALRALRFVAAEMGVLALHQQAYDWLEDDLSGGDYDLQKLDEYLGFVFMPDICSAHNPDAVKQVKSWCNEAGFWENGSASLITPEVLRGVLDSSGSKLDSITNIAASEASTLAEALCLLVLVDQIGSLEDDLDGAGKEAASKVTAVAVFKTLLDQFAVFDSQLALVTGEICIVPGWLATKYEVTIDKPMPATASIANSHSVVSRRKSDIDRLVTACTGEMRSGGLKMLVGTASLLGEGWDCDAINALVLASQIGSYVTSNQMRGRAIRINPDQPEKVANIWHLLTVSGDSIIDRSDFNRLARRFDGFVAPHYDEAYICSGLARVGVDVVSSTSPTRDNAAMLALAGNRQNTANAWQVALDKAGKGLLAQQFCLKQSDVPVRLATAYLFKSKGILPRIINPLMAFYHSGTIDIKTLISQRLAKKVIICLSQQGLLRAPASDFKIKFQGAKEFTVSGGNLKDQTIISESVTQLFSCDCDTRYALAVKLPLCKPLYLFVPKRLGVNKQMVTGLQTHLAKVVGSTTAEFLGDGGKSLHSTLMQSETTDETLTSRRLWV